MRHWPLLLLIACTGDASDADGPDKDVAGDADADADSDSDSDTDSDTDTDFTPDTVPLAGTCAASEHLGGFDVSSDGLFSVVSGAISDGVVPLTIRTVAGSEGDCTLLRQENPPCFPACMSGETCDFDGTCVPFPTEQDAGVVSVEGLSQVVVMEPNPPGFSYYALGLPHPPYTPGDLITLKATGGIHPAFDLHGVGVEALEPFTEVIFIQESTDLVVDWNAPSTEVRSEIFMRINIDQHGITPLSLECVFEDTGSGIVPGTLLDQLINSGVTGIPSGKVSRRTVDSIAVDGGCIDFQVAWSETAEVDVDGFTPCQHTDECPDGEICNTALEICE